MHDNEIINLISSCVNKAIDQGYSIISEFNVKWDIDEWKSIGKYCCPLSVVLLINQAIPDFRLSRGDDLAYSTLSNVFDRRESWIKSFMCAINGESNISDSISGYIMGLKIKKEFCIVNEKEEKD